MSSSSISRYSPPTCRATSRNMPSVSLRRVALCTTLTPPRPLRRVLERLGHVGQDHGFGGPVQVLDVFAHDQQIDAGVWTLDRSQPREQPQLPAYEPVAASKATARGSQERSLQGRAGPLDRRQG